MGRPLLLWLPGVLLLAGCGLRPGAHTPHASPTAAVDQSAARIQRCLDDTGGKLPSLYDPHPEDIPLVRAVPPSCKGIERMVQAVVHRRLLQLCTKATQVLAVGGPPLSDPQRQWAERQLRQCVGGNPDVFYW